MCSIHKKTNNEELFEWLKLLNQVTEVSKDFPLVYKGQVPNVAVYLVNGKIAFSGTSSLLIDAKDPIIVGLTEIISRIPSKKNVVVLKGSQISILSLATLKNDIPDKILSNAI